jgi:sigma-B regulation protein RsbU (phosphoserine phosphatase)
MPKDDHEQNLEQQSKQGSRLPKKSLRSQLLLAVNLPLAAMAAIFLTYDYSREFGHRLEDKRISLEEEAKAIVLAVLQVRHHGAKSVQEYIDVVCGRMRDAESPEHHIAVEMGDETYQATAHHRASPEIIGAIRKAARSPDHRALYGGSELVVGFDDRDGATVYVSESLKNLRSAVRGDILRHLIGYTVMAIVAAVVVNVVLEQVVTKPLGRLVQIVQEIGKGRLGVHAAPFQTKELDYVVSEINAMSSSLAAADRDRKRQMEKARKIQQSLLPNDPNTPGLHVGHIFEPAEDVGGDFYDILPLQDGTRLICVADVTGHGVPAAMTAAMLKILLIQAAEHFDSPADMLNFISQRLMSINPAGDFTTMFLARLDPKTDRLTYASAGHEPALWCSAQGEPQQLDSTGLILGVMKDAAWEEVIIEMKDGDRLLIMTDGVCETFNAQGEMLGRDRVTEWFAESVSLPAEKAAEHIKQMLAHYRGEAQQMDDVTAVLIEVATMEF